MESGLLNSYRASYVRLPSDAYSSGSDAHTSPESDSRKYSRDSSELEPEWNSHGHMKVSPMKGSYLSDYEPESDRGFEDGDVDTEENIEREEYFTDDVASEQVIEDSADDDYDHDSEDLVEDEGPVIHIFAVDPELDLEYSSDENESSECTHVNSVSINSHVENDKLIEYTEHSRENEVDNFPKELNEQCHSRVDDVEEYFVKPKLEKQNLEVCKCEVKSAIDLTDHYKLSKEKLSEREQIEKIKKFLTDDFPETKTSVKSFQKSTSLPQSPHVTYPDLGHSRTLSFEDLNLNDLPDFSVYESKSESSHSKQNNYDFDPTISDTDDIKPLNDEDIDKFLIPQPKIKTEDLSKVTNTITNDDLSQLDMEIDNAIDTKILETAIETRANKIKTEGSLHALDICTQKSDNPANSSRKCNRTNLHEQIYEANSKPKSHLPTYPKNEIDPTTKHTGHPESSDISAKHQLIQKNILKNNQVKDQQNEKNERSFLDNSINNRKSMNANKDLIKQEPDEIVDVESLSEAVALPVLQANNVHSLLEQFEATEKINKDTNTDQIAQIVNPQVYAKPKLCDLNNGTRIQDAALQLNQHKMNPLLITASNNVQNPMSERKFHSDHDYCSPTKKQTLPYNPSKKRQSLLKPEVLTSNMLIKKSRYRACKDKKIIYNLSTDDEESYSEPISGKNNEKILINSNHRKKQVANVPLDVKPLKSVTSVNTLIPLSAKTCDSSQTSSGSIKLTIKNKSKVILKLDCDVSDKHSSLKLFDDQFNSNEPAKTQAKTGNKSGLKVPKNNLNIRSDNVVDLDKQKKIVSNSKMHEASDILIKSDTLYFEPINEEKKEVESVINNENTFIVPNKIQKNIRSSEIKPLKSGCNSTLPGNIIVKNEVVAVLKKENSNFIIPKIEIPCDEQKNILNPGNLINNHDIVNMKKKVGSIQTLENATVKSKIDVQNDSPVILNESEVETNVATICQIRTKKKSVDTQQEENTIIVRPIIDASNGSQTKLTKAGSVIAPKDQINSKKKPVNVPNKENKITLKQKVRVPNANRMDGTRNVPKSGPVISQSNRLNIHAETVTIVSNENTFNAKPEAKFILYKNDKVDKTPRSDKFAISNRGAKMNQSTESKIIPKTVVANVILTNDDGLSLATKGFKDRSQNIIKTEKTEVKLESSVCCVNVTKDDEKSNLPYANGSLYNGVFNMQETKNIVFNDTNTMKTSEHQLETTIKKELCENKEENVEIKQPTKKKLNIQEYKKRKENGHSNDSSRNVSPDAIFPALDKPLEATTTEKYEKPLPVAVQSIQPLTDTKLSPSHESDDSKKVFDPILEASRKILLNTKKQKAEALRKRDESIVMSKIPKIESLELQPLISDVDMQKMADAVKIETLSNGVKHKEGEKCNNSIYEELVLVSIGVNTDIISENFKDDTTVDEKVSKNTINFKIKKHDTVCLSNVFENSRQKESERDSASQFDDRNLKRSTELDEKRFKSATEALKQVERISDAKISSNSLFASIQDTVMKKASGFEQNRSNNSKDGKRFMCSENLTHKSDSSANKADTHKTSQCVKNEITVNKVKSEYTRKQSNGISSKPITILKEYPKDIDHGEDKVIIHLEKNRIKPCVSTVGTQTDLEIYACVKSTTASHSHNLEDSRKRKMNSSSSQENSTISEVEEKRTKTSPDDYRCDVNVKQEKRSISKERPHGDRRSYSKDRYTREPKKSRSMEKRYKDDSRHTSEHRRDMNVRKRSRSIDRHKYSYQKPKACYRSNERRVRRRSRSRCRSKSYDHQRDRRHRKCRSRSRNYRKRSKSRSRNRTIKRERSNFRSRSRDKKYEGKIPDSEKGSQLLDKELETAEFVEKPEDVFDLEAPTAEDLMMPQIFRKPTLSVSSDSSTSSTSTDSSTSSSSSSTSSSSSSNSSTSASTRSIRSRSCASPRRSASRESDASFRSERHQRFNDTGDTPVEERRIVFVGKLTPEVTKSSLRKLFTRFGKINNVTIHIKKNGERYGFVTYGQARDAWTAVGSRSIAQLARFDVGFGGRRAFCRHRYADLDRIEAEYEDRAYPIAPKEDLSFDQMLQEMKKKLSKRKKIDAP